MMLQGARLLSFVLGVLIVVTVPGFIVPAFLVTVVAGFATGPAEAAGGLVGLVLVLAVLLTSGLFLFRRALGGTRQAAGVVSGLACLVIFPPVAFTVLGGFRGHIGLTALVVFPLQVGGGMLLFHGFRSVGQLQAEHGQR